jgi:hypothetical protein
MRLREHREGYYEYHDEQQAPSQFYFQQLFHHLSPLIS